MQLILNRGTVFVCAIIRSKKLSLISLCELWFLGLWATQNIDRQKDSWANFPWSEWKVFFLVLGNTKGSVYSRPAAPGLVLGCTTCRALCSGSCLAWQQWVWLPALLQGIPLHGAQVLPNHRQLLLCCWLSGTWCAQFGQCRVQHWACQRKRKAVVIWSIDWNMVS